MTKISIFAVSCLAIIALAGCAPGSATKWSVPPNSTVAQTLTMLVAQGKLPTLDVSATVEGTDSNGNGVRDDLDKYIAALPDTAQQKSALIQLAKAIQATLTLDTTNAQALTAASDGLNRGDTCIWQQYAGSNPTLKVNTLEELTINTQTRLIAYEKYNAAMNGTAVPSLTGSACQSN